MYDFLFMLIQKLKKRVNTLSESISTIKANKVSRFVIGTSTAGWTTNDCDYLCDGTNDQIEINAAITALPTTGGEIVILDGTYNITAKIDVIKNNVSIKGNGNSTILKRMWDGGNYEGIITLTSVSNCNIQNLYVNGNNDVYTSSTNYGIYLLSSSNNVIINNMCNKNYYGIKLLTDSNNNVISKNTTSNNQTGIVVQSSNNNIINGNMCTTNNIGFGYGILIVSGNNNTVTANANIDNPTGIQIQSSNNNIINGNMCIRGSGLTTDYTTSQYTINLPSIDNNYNLISSNQCMGKAVIIGGGTSNTSVNNKYN